VTDQNQGLIGDISKVVTERLRSTTKPNGPEPTPMPEHPPPLLPRSTALQSIAQQISRLSYFDMMLLAKSLHHQNDQVLAEHPVEIADLLHGWAVKELEASSTATA
jgi:hypothetical protein